MQISDKKTLEIGERINFLNSIFHEHVNALGLILKLDMHVPHILTERLFFKCQENDPCLTRIIPGNEKWVVTNNVKHKESWSKKDEPTLYTSKFNIHQTKCDFKFSGISRDFLKPILDNTTINADVYGHQLYNSHYSIKPESLKIQKNQ